MSYPTARQPGWELFPLRLIVGIVFIAHGWLKLHTIGIAGTTQFMTKMGIPMPGISAVGVSGLELIGGLALILGAGTRLFAPLLAVDMLGAIYFAKRSAGFFSPSGWEFELVLCAACVTLTLAGAGGASIDAWRAKEGAKRRSAGS